MVAFPASEEAAGELVYVRAPSIASARAYGKVGGGDPDAAPRAGRAAIGNAAGADQAGEVLLGVPGAPSGLGEAQELVLGAVEGGLDALGGPFQGAGARHVAERLTQLSSLSADLGEAAADGVRIAVDWLDCATPHGTRARLPEACRASWSTDHDGVRARSRGSCATPLRVLG
jgi:hypothetical protein